MQMEVRRRGDENANEEEADFCRPGDGMLMVTPLITDDFSWESRDVEEC